MIRYEIKQLYRTPLRVTILALALAVMSVAVTISTGLHLASVSALEHMESHYITTAQPIPPRVESYDTMAQYIKAEEKYTGQLFLFKRIASDMVSIETYTDHSAYAAYGADITPLICDEGSFSQRRPNNLVVLSVCCTRVDELMRTTGYGKKEMPLTVYRLTVEDIVLSHEDLTVAPEIIVSTGIRLEDGGTPFTVGERYLIWGLYDGVSPNYGKLMLPTDMTPSLTDPVLTASEDGVHLTTYYQKNDGVRPIIVRLGSSSVEEFMKTEASSAWNEVMEIARISVDSLRIFSTDCVLAHSALIGNQAQLIAGRDFTKEELTNGDRVCILNADLAEQNGLSLGASIPLSFYATNFVAEEMFFDSASYPNRLYTPGFRTEQVDAESGEYTIVGLYRLDTLGESTTTALHPNTVLVPQSALHQVYATHPYSSFTIVLPNGGIDAFEEEFATLGLDLKFQYDDQGYAETVPHLTMLHTSVRAIHRLCICLWVLVMAVLIMMYLMMQNAAAQVKFRVGVSRGRIFGHTVFGGLLLLVISSVLGGVASVTLYNTVLEKLMDSDFTVFYAAFGSKSESTEILTRVFDFMQQSPEMLIRICAMQLGAAAVLLILFAAWLYLRPAHYRK